MALPQPMIGAPETATGVVARAELGTTLPTDASSVLDTKFKKLGLVSDEGEKMSVERSTDKIRAQGGQVARIIQTEFTQSLEFTLLESTNADVLKSVFGDKNVAVGEGTVTIKHNADLPLAGVFVVTLKDGERKRRLVIPNGQLTISGEIQYVHSNVITYPVSIECQADEEGNTMYEYVADASIHAG